MKKILFLIVILVLTGCVSRKSALKENVKLDAVQVTEKSETFAANDNVQIITTRGDKTNVTDKSVTRVVETEFTDPDPQGRQFPKTVRETETRNDVSTDNEKDEKIITELKSSNETLTTEVTELTTKLDQALRQNSKTTTKVPIWTYVVTLIAGAVLALMIKRWVKGKFNL